MKIESHIDSQSSSYKERLAFHSKVIEEFEKDLEFIRNSSGEKGRVREHKKNKLTDT